MRKRLLKWARAPGRWVAGNRVLSLGMCICQEGEREEEVLGIKDGGHSDLSCQTAARHPPAQGGTAPARELLAS